MFLSFSKRSRLFLSQWHRNSQHQMKSESCSRLTGYALVGVEQTHTSVPLDQLGSQPSRGGDDSLSYVYALVYIHIHRSVSRTDGLRVPVDIKVTASSGFLPIGLLQFCERSAVPGFSSHALRPGRCGVLLL